MSRQQYVSRMIFYKAICPNIRNTADSEKAECQWSTEACMQWFSEWCIIVQEQGGWLEICVCSTLALPSAHLLYYTVSHKAQFSMKYKCRCWNAHKHQYSTISSLELCAKFAPKAQLLFQWIFDTFESRTFRKGLEPGLLNSSFFYYYYYYFSQVSFQNTSLTHTSTAQTLWEHLNLVQKPQPMLLKSEGDYLLRNTGAAGLFVPSRIVDCVNRKATDGLVCKDNLIGRWYARKQQQDIRKTRHQED